MIENAEERRAISGILLPLIPGVTPSSSRNKEWRYQVGWAYLLLKKRISGGHNELLMLQFSQMQYITPELEIVELP